MKQPNFSVVIFHYLNSSLPFHQKALSLHRTISFSSILTPLEPLAMINRILILFSITIASVISSTAQVPITIKNNWMYVDASFSYGGKDIPISALIDTGASVCIMDSIFATDSCNIKIEKSNAVIGNTNGKKVVSFKFNLDSINLGGHKYYDVCCYILNLSGMFAQYAPKFIIGGDVLKRDYWEFDLGKFSMIQRTIIPQNIQYQLHWKNHEDYSSAFLNAIIFQGKIAGQKTKILFDTGSRTNKIPRSFGVMPTKIETQEVANVAEALRKETRGVCENTPVALKDWDFTLDFVVSEEKIPRLNIDFLKGKSFILSYKQKSLYVLY